MADIYIQKAGACHTLHPWGITGHNPPEAEHTVQLPQMGTETQSRYKAFGTHVYSTYTGLLNQIRS